ncbi:hypothetical protein R3P38DRAFT_2799986 [Favolaschia claudopus]|uniref:Uncharacterized protein n=1 Tax=Favolaschia claudopus TaxID=2862362 RepID=A0AAV9ZYF6_9AGAR
MKLVALIPVCYDSKCSAASGYRACTPRSLSSAFAASRSCLLSETTTSGHGVRTPRRERARCRPRISEQRAYVRDRRFDIARGLVFACALTAVSFSQFLVDPYEHYWAGCSSLTRSLDLDRGLLGINFDGVPVGEPGRADPNCTLLHISLLSHGYAITFDGVPVGDQASTLHSHTDFDHPRQKGEQAPPIKALQFDKSQVGHGIFGSVIRIVSAYSGWGGFFSSSFEYNITLCEESL